MITSIIHVFREQAREHRSIKAFYYNRNYELGSGKEQYPLFWLEDPIYGTNRDNAFVNSLSFSILFAPDQEHDVSAMQSLAFSVGLNIIERIRHDATQPIRIHPDWSYTTLSDYYDDNACGCRFSVSFTQANMQNLCLIDEQFDTNKDFEDQSFLNDFELEGDDRLEVFRHKLPEFNLRTRK